MQSQQEREFAAMRQGIIDVLCGAPINWSGAVRECSAFALPFLTPDHKAYDTLISSEPVQKDSFDIIRKAGAEPLAVGETGFRQLTNSKRAVREPEDLKVLALKIHTLGQKFVTKWNYSNDILLFAIANPIWQSWSPQDQKIVRDAAQDAAAANIKLVRDIYAKDVELVRGVGVDVTVPTPAEMEAWQIACRRPYARWKAQINPTLIGKFEEVIARTRKA